MVDDARTSREGGGFAPGPLPPSELAARLDHVLADAERLLHAVPEPYVEHRPSGQDQTIGDLAYRVFRLGLAFADGMDTGRVPASWLSERAPAELRDAGAVARYGALVRGRVGGWFEGAAPSEYGRSIEVSGRPESGHALLERLTALAVARVRDLAEAVAELGIEVSPPRPEPRQ